MSSLRSFSERYISILCRARYVVLLLWVLIGGGLAIFVMKFVSATTQQFSPPAGTAAATAQDQLRDSFPVLKEATFFNAVLTLEEDQQQQRHSPSISIVDVPQVRTFAEELGAGLAREFGSDLVRYTNYFELLRASPPLEIIADGLLNKANTSLVLPIVLKVQFTTKKAQAYGERLQDVLSRTNHFLESSESHVTSYANGIPIMIKSVTENTQRDLGMMDAIVIPVAILVMGGTVGSLRLMILPVACVALTLVTSFALMYFVTFAMDVSVTTPSLMMSLSIAMSFDYNLFIASRFVEELRAQGVSGPHVVSTVVRTAGATIVVSGVSLVVSLLGLIFFPLDMLRTFGVGCGLCVFIAMLVALTFSPAMLIAFPNFFEAAAKPTILPAWAPMWLRLRFNGKEQVECQEQEKEALLFHGTDRASSVSPSGTPRGFDSKSSKATGADQNGGFDHNNLSPSPQRLLAPHMGGGDPTKLNSSPPLGPAGGFRRASSMMSNGSTTATPRLSSTNLPAASPASLAGSHGSVHLSNIDEHLRRQKSIFYRIRNILRFPYNLLVFLLLSGLCIGVAVQSTRFKTTDDFLSYLSRGSQERKHFETFADEFGFSFTEPYYFLFKNTERTNGEEKNAMMTTSDLSLTNPFVFEYCQGFLKRLTTDKELPSPTPVSIFTGIFAMNGAWNSYDDVMVCLAAAANKNRTTGAPPSSVDDEEMLKGIDAKMLATSTADKSVRDGTKTPVCDPNLGAFLQSTATKDLDAFYNLAKVTFSPTGNLGDPYYRRLLTIAHEYKKEHLDDDSEATSAELKAVAKAFDIYVSGIGPDSMDAIDVIYSLFPVIVGVSGGAVLVIVGLAFRSALVPLRSVVSIAMTEGFVFGLVVLVYQSPGILNWMHWPAVAHHGAVSWTAPIVAFSVILGVALDYDMFLTTRIQEFVVDEGMGTREAILHGLSATGKIITAAGVIMAVAFCGLLLSTTPVLNLLGFFMVIAVLFDTFVVRPLVVPTLMSLLGKWNWWPRKL